ncbi:cation acetate symporter [Planctomyces sp. SH-PL14]|uniref:sodium/solute symporter n=1 Tax=Planctomyces sp. SH-PL14 TaxID=1632864 RepID=UPI00078C68FF|nr:cation acetate symporter [Planctomyces sp. SH-PL14]AMV19547.1 Cation/acetate symporter ActP [Planctomyces sp. SH-PL14]
MIYEPSFVAVAIFGLFVAFTLGLSFYLGGKAKSAQGYFAAHGQIPWFVNGIAFAGDYLSAASFLGICGMIAFYGYDGFLYSIGYLAGWIVALFVIAEPMKALGKFTFADALDAKFHSRGIKLAAGISTLVVSLFYLIPQMVGAGVLIQPLFGFAPWVGVVLVGTVVILIVVTAGMVSTTWVQFLKGSLLVFFSLILTVMILNGGLETRSGGNDGHEFLSYGPIAKDRLDRVLPGWRSNGTNDPGSRAEDRPTAPGRLLRNPPSPDAGGTEPQVLMPVVVPPEGDGWKDRPYVRTRDDKGETIVWSISENPEGAVTLREAQTVTKTADGKTLVNGQPKGTKAGEPELHPVGHISRLPEGATKTGPLSPTGYLATLQQSEVVLWREDPVAIKQADGSAVTVFTQKPTPGNEILRPGETAAFKGIRSPYLKDKINFLSLMLALFCGTASLPHILIRYYTVKDAAAARKSTIVGIASIGAFYVLTLYLGLGAMTSGALDVTNSNMAAPLLARSMSQWLFATISGIAFTTVLGTVSGLILAAAGAVTHDLVGHVFRIELDDSEKVRLAKLASVVVGAVAIVLGIVFMKMNVTYLVGWAFSVAASANLPSLVMLLFWKGVTRQGVIAAVTVGMTSSLAWILLSADTYKEIYKLNPADAPVPFSQPGIVTIPLGFLTLIVVSLLTRGWDSRRDPSAA